VIMKILTATLFLLLAISGVRAQRVTLAERDIPRLPVDTLPTDREEVRLVTYSDGTFRFIPTNPYHFLSAPAYENHWDTVNLFAYRDIALSDLPERIMVEMAESHGFSMPVNRTEGSTDSRRFVVSQYGRRSGRDHNGIDLKVVQGQPIYAAFDGIVRVSRWNSGGFGHIVIVRHANGLETYYAHLSRRAVTASEWVRAGQVIGYGGATGRASAPHLHFETRYFDQNFDPEWIIDFEEGVLPSRLFGLRKDHFRIRSHARSIIPDNSVTSDALAENTPVTPENTPSISPAIDAAIDLLEASLSSAN
jgi:murein DD-endopeptidase MepM/ murein hydrolase activator NlpD